MLFELPEKDFLPYWLLIWVLLLSLVTIAVTVIVQFIRQKPVLTQAPAQQRKNKWILLLVLLAYGLGISCLLYKMNAPFREVIYIPVVMVALAGVRLLRWFR